jgi:hypothetical protein
MILDVKVPHDGLDATTDVTAAADEAVSNYATISDATILTDNANANVAMKHQAWKSEKVLKRLFNSKSRNL